MATTDRTPDTGDAETQTLPGLVADDPPGAITGRLAGRRVAFLVANEGVEQVELTAPWEAVRYNGGEPVLIAPTGEIVQAYRHLDAGDEYDPDLTLASASTDDYDALVLPGGVANADALRTEDDAVEFARRFLESGRPVAAICHAPWLLVETGEMDGRHLTSWPSLATDLRNAGAEWTDDALVIDGNLITSRKPDDLGVFCDALLAALDDRVPAV